MKRLSRKTMASLLVTAVLSAPGGAFAASPVTVDSMEAISKSVKIVAPAVPEAGQLVAPKLTRDEAIAVANRYFTIPKELGQPNVNIAQDQNMASWSLHWQSSSKEVEQTWISVTIDAVSGSVLSYSYSKSFEEGAQLSFTRAEAKAKAQEWFERLVPEADRAQVKSVDPRFNANYWGGAAHRFQWDLMVDGYPVTGQGIAIAVDARTGALLEFSNSVASLQDLVKPDKVLTQAEAEALYAKQLSMTLQYQQIYNHFTDESEWRLVYRPTTDSVRMDQDGRFLDYDGNPVDPAAAWQPKLVPASEKPYEKPAALLDQAAALAVAQAVRGTKDAPRHISYREEGDEVKRSFWDFAWTVEGDESAKGSDYRIQVDAATGLISEMYHWKETKSFEPGEKAKVSLDQAAEIAAQFIRTHRPDLAGQLQTTRTGGYDHSIDGYQPTEYYLTFEYLHNKIPVSNRSVTIQVNARTGEVSHFWAHGLEVGNEKFPVAAGVITAEQAINSFMKQQGIQAGWSRFWNRDNYAEGSVRLVWQPAWDSAFIDAFTGRPTDWEGRDLIEAQRYPSDIAGHPAEREIELLWTRGVIDLKDGKFLPDQAISADDLVRWIVLSGGMRPYRGYDFKMALAGASGSLVSQVAEGANSAYYGAALRSGIILPEDLTLLKDVTGPVSRELVALWSARAMGYGRIAKMAAKIEMSFTDQEQIGQKYRNAVALLGGLGILTANADGKVEPQRSLTRGEAAQMLFAISGR